MGATKSTMTWFLALALSITFVPSPPMAYTAQKSEGDRTDASPIRLILQTSKEKYQVGDPIEIFSYLENRSDKTYYVGNELVGLSTLSSFHYILVTIVDASNREVAEVRGAATSVWDAGTTIKEKLEQAYTPLRPNTIFGVKERGNILLAPGQYRMTATYREVEALSWTEAERNALSIPVWTQPLVSNTVTITVSPKSSTRHRR